MIRPVALGMAAAALVAGVAWLAWQPIADRALTAARQQADDTLRLTVLGLEGFLLRFRAVPDLLAAQDDIRHFALAPGDADLAAAVAALMAETARATDAARILIADEAGRVIAAAPARLPAPQTVAHQPWFAQALARGEGQAFSVSAMTGERVQTFATRLPGPAAAVIAVSVTLDEVEAEWRRLAEPVIVSDAQGAVFLSTRRDWRPGSVREGGGGPVAARSTPRRVPVVRVAGGARFVEARVLMPLPDWTVHVWVDFAPYAASARLATGLVAVATALAGAAVGLVLQRRAQLAERFRLTEGARARLEERVAARTAELETLNARLEVEVQERTAAEAELRRTQADLIQAGKLAALGQMSAALSHEINQPLAAARNFADSAAKLIERGEPARAQGNLGQILGLIDRMSTIARHLRDVARKPDRPLGEVSLAETLAEALATARPRLDAAGAKVALDLPADLPPVRAGPVRLGQVLVNLLSNAADAVEGRAERRIAITARAQDGGVRLAIADTGPGVPPAIAHRIFDPFFTTKTVGAGLGLGLSISYNMVKDFGGELRVEQAPGGGAAFVMDLRRARGG